MKRWSSEYAKVLQRLLFPILLLQGYLVRKKAIELPEARGQRHGKFGYGSALSILLSEIRLPVVLVWIALKIPYLVVSCSR